MQAKSYISLETRYYNGDGRWVWAKDMYRQIDNSTQLVKGQVVGIPYHYVMDEFKIEPFRAFEYFNTHDNLTMQFEGHNMKCLSHSLIADATYWEVLD